MMHESEPQQRGAHMAPVDYYATVWIESVALREIPDIYAPIEATYHHGDVLHITAEREDGLCQTEDGFWVLGVALRRLQ